MTTLPKSENGYGVLYKGLKYEYVISQNTNKHIFTLWKLIETQYEKLATGNSPIKLYDKINQLEKAHK